VAPASGSTEPPPTFHGRSTVVPPARSRFASARQRHTACVPPALPVGNEVKRELDRSHRRHDRRIGDRVVVAGVFVAQGCVAAQAPAQATAQSAGLAAAGATVVPETVYVNPAPTPPVIHVTQTSPPGQPPIVHDRGRVQSNVGPANGGLIETAGRPGGLRWPT
jgi:hypothetical protein